MSAAFKFFLLFCSVIAINACSFAQKKIRNSNRIPFALILDASSQTIFPGVQEAELETKYEFSLIWKSKNTPQAIFWRNNDSWMTTQIFRISRKNQASDEAPMQTEIGPSSLKVGDSILILPLKSGKYLMPSKVRLSKEKVALAFQMNNNSWNYLAIKKISKKADILMP